MVGFLLRRFVKNCENVDDPAVRRGYGEVCGLTGIGINILLFLCKLIAGLMSGSIAVVADAFNNLSDAGASIVTLMGFRLAEKAPDRDHPYGHGRFEYISGLLVSVAILLMSVELLRSGLEKIFRPGPVEAGAALTAVLAASIALKLYMAYYNRKYGRMIDSAAMSATATDSLGDCAATGAVLAAIVIERLTGLNIDGWAGALVAVLIGIAGVRSFKETLDPLLGQAPDAELIRRIREIAGSYKETRGIHDIVVHDYGPGRRMISLHVEVDGGGDIYELHDAVDAMERELAEKLRCSAVIHMDPIYVDGRQSPDLREEITRVLRSRVDERITIHDLRIQPGNNCTLLCFDSAVPPELAEDAETVRKNICRAVEESFSGCQARTVIDFGLDGDK